MKHQIPLAWLQLIREKGRFLVAVSGIAFADVLILMQLGFQTALYDSNTRLHESLRNDLVLISPQARNIANMTTFPRRRLYQARNVSEVVSVEGLYVDYGDWNNPQTHRRTGILLIGFDPTKQVFNLSEVNQNLNQLKLPDTVLFDRSSRGAYQDAIEQVTQGKPVSTEVQGRKVEIGGLFSIGASFVADGSLIMSDQNFLRIFPRRQASEISVGLITLQLGADRAAVANVLRSYLPNDVKILTREEFSDFEKQYWRDNTAIGFIFSLGMGMGFVVGVIIVYQILYSDVTDHMAEYATLKAMGYRSLYLLSVVFQEAFILAIFGYIPGNLISIGLYALTRAATNLPLYMQAERVIQVFIATILMCAISGAIAMRKLRSADPADIF